MTDKADVEETFDLRDGLKAQTKTEGNLSGMSYYKDPPLSQSELIDAIADKVYEKLLPEFGELYARQERGMLIGMPQIGGYLATLSAKREVRPVTGQTLRNWHSKLGLPLSKSPQDNWCIMKSDVDKWVYNRGALMRKLNELGYKVLCGRGKGGFISNAPPEKYKPEELAHAKRELIKDKIKFMGGD